MDPDRSASTVGDLLELHGGRTGLGFGIDVVRVGLVHLAHSLIQDPVKTLRISALAFGLATLAAMSIVSCFLVLEQFSQKDARFLERLFWMQHAWVIVLTCSYSIGRWMSQRSRGRELPVAVAVYLLVCFLFDPAMAAIGSTAVSLANGHHLYAMPAVIGQISFDLRSQLGFLAAGVVSRILSLRSSTQLAPQH